MESYLSTTDNQFGFNFKNGHSADHCIYVLKNLFSTTETTLALCIDVYRGYDSPVCRGYDSPVCRGYDSPVCRGYDSPVYRGYDSPVYTCLLDAPKAFDRVNHLKCFIAHTYSLIHVLVQNPNVLY